MPAAQHNLAFSAQASSHRIDLAKDAKKCIQEFLCTKWNMVPSWPLC